MDEIPEEPDSLDLGQDRVSPSPDGHDIVDVPNQTAYRQCIMTEHPHCAANLDLAAQRLLTV